MAKVYTAVLNDRLYSEMETRGLHMPSQGGFVRGRRTTDNLFIINTVRETSKRKHKPLFCIILNVAKAYDCVDRTRLTRILKTHNFSPLLSRAIISSLLHTKYAVNMGGKVTSFFPTVMGLKQGDSISPLLFNLYVHDLQTTVLPGEPCDYVPVINI